MASLSPLKRSYDDAALEAPQHYQCQDELPHENENSNLPAESSSSPMNVDSAISTPLKTRASSSTPSRSGSITRDGSPPPTSTPHLGNPTKRRKISLAEKEMKRIEKESKEQQRAEEKARKEEEKRIKDEEKRIKDEIVKEDKKRKEEEKEERRKAKEAEKQVRDEERRKKETEKKVKEDERLKKEKSQLRLNTFFAKPTVLLGEVDGSVIRERDGSLSRRSSVASLDGLSSMASSRSVSMVPEGAYDRNFPSFFVQSFTTLAPINRFFRDEEGVETVRRDIDETLSNSDSIDQQEDVFEEDQGVHFDRLLHLPPHKRRRRYKRTVSVRDIIGQIHGTITNPMQVSNSNTRHRVQKPIDLLKSTSLKYLCFAEDVRPPYIGTYTKLPPAHSTLRLCRKPFTRALPATNYDYDSEVEWEEPGEGEDLNSEGEEDIDNEEEVDDMEGFLDDEEATDGLGMKGTKRRHIMGDVQPIATDLCWEHSAATSQAFMVPYGDTSLDLRPFKLEIFLAHPQLPIDPYSTSYWPPPTTSTLQHSQTSTHLATNMPPPRLPLHAVNSSNTLLPLPFSKPSLITTATPGTSASLKQPKKPLPPEILADFKAAIEGSELTKAGLVEVLKKQFPKASKDTIKDTLVLVAERRGDKEADKRWYLRG